MFYESLIILNISALNFSEGVAASVLGLVGIIRPNRIEFPLVLIIETYQVLRKHIQHCT